MYYLDSAIADRINVDIVHCFDDGVKDGIQIAWPTTDGRAPANTRTASIWDAIRVTTSSTSENVYTFAGSDYEMEETTGDEKPYFEDRIYEQTLVNGRSKKRVLQIELTEFSDDKLGKARARFHAAGTALIVKPYRFLVGMIGSGKDKGGKGAAIKCFDGQPFYGDHPIDPRFAVSSTNKWVNDIVRSGGLTPGAGGTFEELWNLMTAIPGEDGEVVGSRPTHLAVGQLDFWAGVDCCKMVNTSTGQGGGNRGLGLCELIYVPEWKAGEVVMLDASNSLERGFIFQEREKNTLRPLFTNPEGSIERREGALTWQVDGRWEAGVGSPRRAVRLRRG